MDLLAAAEKIEQGQKPPPKAAVAQQNEQSYNLLGQMLSGVQGAPTKKPRNVK